VYRLYRHKFKQLLQQSMLFWKYIVVCKLVTCFIFSADCTYEYSETQMYVCMISCSYSYGCWQFSLLGYKDVVQLSQWMFWTKLTPSSGSVCCLLHGGFLHSVLLNIEAGGDCYYVTTKWMPHDIHGKTELRLFYFSTAQQIILFGSMNEKSQLFTPTNSFRVFLYSVHHVVHSVHFSVLPNSGQRANIVKLSCLKTNDIHSCELG
jgi:hypothetical protein